MTNQRESHTNPSQQQSDKSKQAARELEADEDQQQRWEEKLKRVAKMKSDLTDE